MLLHHDLGTHFDVGLQKQIAGRPTRRTTASGVQCDTVTSLSLPQQTAVSTHYYAVLIVPYRSVILSEL